MLAPAEPLVRRVSRASAAGDKPARETRRMRKLVLIESSDSFSRNGLMMGERLPLDLPRVLAPSCSLFADKLSIGGRSTATIPLHAPHFPLSPSLYLRSWSSRALGFPCVVLA